MVKLLKKEPAPQVRFRLGTWNQLHQRGRYLSPTRMQASPPQSPRHRFSSLLHASPPDAFKVRKTPFSPGDSPANLLKKLEQGTVTHLPVGKKAGEGPWLYAGANYYKHNGLEVTIPGRNRLGKNTLPLFKQRKGVFSRLIPPRNSYLQPS